MWPLLTLYSLPGFYGFKWFFWENVSWNSHIDTNLKKNRHIMKNSSIYSYNDYYSVTRDLELGAITAIQINFKI